MTSFYYVCVFLTFLFSVSRVFGVFFLFYILCTSCTIFKNNNNSNWKELCVHVCVRYTPAELRRLPVNTVLNEREVDVKQDTTCDERHNDDVEQQDEVADVSCVPLAADDHNNDTPAQVYIIAAATAAAADDDDDDEEEEDDDDDGETTRR